MVEPVSGAAGAAAGLAGDALGALTPSISAVIGAYLLPVATERGNDKLDRYIEKRNKRQMKVAERAARIAQPEIEAGGEPPERVVDAVLTAAAVADDDLLEGYLSGVLASSVTSRPKDDRALASVEKIRQMSHYALRCHFSLYTAFRIKLRGSGLNLGTQEHEAKIFVGALQLAMSIGMEADQDFSELFNYSIDSLVSQNLIHADYWGGREFLASKVPGAPTDGLVCGPTRSGADLYRRVYGKSGWSNTDLFDPDVNWPDVGLPASTVTAWTLKEVKLVSDGGN